MLTPGVCLITQSDVKCLTILEKRPLLTELFLHKKHTVQKSVKFLGRTSGAGQTQSDFHMELPLVEVFSSIAFREKLDHVILDEYSHDNGNFLILHVLVFAFKVWL